MRTVTGRTERVVVVGAGLGGLSATLRLLGAGRQVTVLEREAIPGGRAGLLERDGYRFDTGPTVLTMPELIDDALSSVGERMTDWLRLRPLDPAYRAHFADGTTLDVHTDTEAMTEEVARVCGPAEALGYRRWVGHVTRLFRLQIDDFIDRNLDSPLDLLRPNLARLVAAGGFRRLAPTVGQFLRDPRTQRVFSFQSLYAGLSPYDALALYAVIGYLDCVAGVHAPVGGMHEVPRALAGAAAKHGASFRYSTAVVRIETRAGRAVAVHTADGERIPCDAVVLNPDLPVAYRDLLGQLPRAVRRLRYSPSCFLLLAGSTATYSRTRHHDIFFGQQWRGVFTDLIDRRRLMGDPSLLVTNPTHTDPSLAPDGRQVYYVLAPVPHLTGDPRTDLDWRRLGPSYRDDVVRVLEERGYVGFEAAIEVEDVTTPLDWQARGLQRGTPFAAAHTFAQTGPFRPGNLWGDNVVFVGSGTVPGVGVPMVLISGRLAAERITGRCRNRPGAQQSP